MNLQPEAVLDHILAHRPVTNPDKVMNLYDFDGVLASPLEEALFTMPMGPHDSEFIIRVSKRFNMDLSQESLASQRYICIQAVLWRYDVPISHGPINPDGTNPYYILTARSDRFAIRRMHDFVRYDLLVEPIKMQHLDHLPKGQAISVLLERHPETHFRFYDDNPRHILSARMLRSARLEVFHVDNDMEPFYVEAESMFKNQILELAL